MKKNCVLILDQEDMKSALADFFARVLSDLETTRQRLIEGQIHTYIPNLTTAQDDDLIRYYTEFDLGFALLSENPEADAVLIDLGNVWHVAAQRESIGQE